MVNLKRKLAALATIGATLVGSFAMTGSASAQGGGPYGTAYVTSVTYQNVGAADTTVNFTFYQQNSTTSFPVARPLARNASDSLFLGNASELSGFSGAGSAVMAANEPVIATIVQIPTGNPNIRNRPLSNGFSSDAGANSYLIATVLKNQANRTSRFAVQNADTAAVNGTVKFFDASSNPPGALRHTAQISNLPSGASVYLDAGTINELGASFNGSAVIETSGKVVAAALELSTTNNVEALSFEGVTTGANTVYMPSALCRVGGQETFYAIQNTSTTAAAQVTVTFNNGNTVGPLSVAAGAKTSVAGCSANNPSGFNGSATITSQGAPIVAIGKVGGGGLYTGFVGATGGAAKLALPYVRWTVSRYDTNPNPRQRTFVAIQNIGTADLAAGAVTVRYVDRTGQTVGTHTLPAIARGGKTNSTAPQATGNPAVLNEFGYTGTAIGGGAIIECSAPNCQLVAVARVTSNNGGSSQVGEDYNGIPIN